MAHMSRESVAWGDAGIEQTLAIMSQLVSDGVDTPSVVGFARRLAVQAGVRRSALQAMTIQAFLQRVWRFVNDPADRELLVAPDVLLANYHVAGYIAGDCDEAAVLGATLGKAIGLAPTWTVYAFEDGPPETWTYHVFAALLTDDGRTVSLDVTRPAGPVPAPSRILTMDA